MRQIGGSEVDVEANFIVFRVEADHPAVAEKVGGFAYRQNRQAAQALEQRALPTGFVPAQKEDVASLDFLSLVELADVKYAGADRFAFDGVAQFQKVRIAVEDAQIQGRFSAVEGAARPFYKLRKMVKKRGFDLVLFGGGLRAGRL